MTAPNWQHFLDVAGSDADALAARLQDRAVCAHQHRIDLANAPGIRGSHFTPQVKRDWSLDDLRAATDLTGVARRVLVAVVDPWDGDDGSRTAPNLGDVEAEALATIGRDEPDCLGSVVSVDYTAPREALEARMAALGKHPGVSGLRLIHTQGTPVGDNPFADPRFLDYCELAAEQGLNVELLCREALGQYDMVVELLARFGGQWPVVINHGANPDGFTSGGPSPAYIRLLDALAARGNVAMKTALDEWAPTGAPATTFYPYWNAMVEAGGYDWLLFETNYPVSLESGHYGSPDEGFRDALGRQMAWLVEGGHADAFDDFFWRNAERVYGHFS